MLNKKGAVELSMTTIIVIIIGVALLTFGLVFVNKIRSGVVGISDQTFDEANKILQEGLSDVTKFLTLSPDNIQIEPGKDRAVGVTVLNLEESEIQVSLTATPIKDPKLKCEFFDTKETKSQAYTLASGAKETIPFVVTDLDGGIRTTGCRIVVSGGPTSGNQASLIVRVGKQK